MFIIMAFVGVLLLLVAILNFMAVPRALSNEGFGSTMMALASLLVATTTGTAAFVMLLNAVQLASGS